MEAARVVHLQEGTGLQSSLLINILCWWGETLGLRSSDISPRRANVLFAHTGCLYLRWDLGVAVRTAAMSFRQDSPRHSLAGKIFVAAMLTMAVAAVYLAIVRLQPKTSAGF
jgi:hypothetical protein